MNVATQEDYLMQRAARGDGSALDRLYALLAPALCSYLRRLCASRDQADDLLQITFLNAWRSRSRFRGTGARAWLFTIARNAFLTEAGRPPPPAPPTIDQRAATAEQTVVAVELSVRLERALRRLPAATREAVVLSRVSGLSIAEIAELLDTSPGNVRVRIHRGLSELKEVLAHDS